jgi:uncharacterized phage protein (TIGR01671 family)
MREIKFRAWHPRGGHLEEHTMTYWKLGTGLDNSVFFNTAKAVMQYTGLKDKNGKEIYEGDIVEHRNYIKELLGSYEVRGGAWNFTLYDPKKPEVRSHYISPDQLEVVGNVHEHPELLIKP